jgi:hypothetical protein
VDDLFGAPGPSGRPRLRRGGGAIRLPRRLWPPQTPAERAALEGARARLDRLELYPRPVRLRGVRVLHWPWWFRLPWCRRFTGYALGPLILLRRPLSQSADDLLVHELCHVWQWQDHHLRMWLSYLTEGYRDNRHEVEARRAASG